MKTLIIFISLFLALPAFAAEPQKIYDKDMKQVGTVKDGRIYDKDYRQQGTIKDGRVYDKNYRQKGTVR